MTIITAKDGSIWRVHGINMISTDSIYKRIKEVIDSGDVTQKALQGGTGHLSPVLVDTDNQTIEFQRF